MKKKTSFRMEYSPFRYSYIDEGREVIYTFTCPKCHGHNVTKILKPFGELCFWSGYYMCSDCGTSLCDGEQICYYSSCFKRLEKSLPLQLELF